MDVLWILLVATVLVVLLVGALGGFFLALDGDGHQAIGAGIALPCLVLLVAGAIVMVQGSSQPLAPGCYYADVTTTTTYVMVGKVLAPVTSDGNRFYPITCPPGVGNG